MTHITDMTVMRTTLRKINTYVFSQFGDRVVSGPFEGMIVNEHPVWDDGNEGCKLLGIYEHELHDVIERMIAQRPEVIVNVGCAEGYYAIGMKLRLLGSEVIAIDKSKKSLTMCDQMAERNGVIIRTRIGCTQPSELNLAYGRSKLYILDVEGNELKLLQPDQCQELITSDIIVECHDFKNPNMPASNILAARFSKTHDIERITAQLPDPLLYLKLMRDLPIDTKPLGLIEIRPTPTTWLALTAKK